MDADTEHVTYDCRKIHISNEVQDLIYESYRMRYPNYYSDGPKNFDGHATLILAQKGPKVSGILTGLSVEILPGFIEKERVVSSEW